jgi:hypothetical protein
MVTLSELRYFFYVGVAFIIVIDNFYTMKTIRSNIICQLSSLFAMKERKSAIRRIFNCYFRVLTFKYVSNRVAGNCHTSYRYCCPSLLTVLQLSVLRLTLTVRTHSPTDDHNFPERLQRKSAVTR